MGAKILHKFSPEIMDNNSALCTMDKAEKICRDVCKHLEELYSEPKLTVQEFQATEK